MKTNRKERDKAIAEYTSEIAKIVTESFMKSPVATNEFVRTWKNPEGRSRMLEKLKNDSERYMKEIERLLSEPEGYA